MMKKLIILGLGLIVTGCAQFVQTHNVYDTRLQSEIRPESFPRTFSFVRVRTVDGKHSGRMARYSKKQREDIFKHVARQKVKTYCGKKGYKMTAKPNFLDNMTYMTGTMMESGGRNTYPHMISWHFECNK